MTHKERPTVVQRTPTRIRGTVASHLNTMETIQDFREWLCDKASPRNKYGYENTNAALYEELQHALGDAEDSNELVAQAMEFYKTVPKDQRGRGAQPYVKKGNPDAPPTDKQLSYLRSLGYKDSDGKVPDRKTAGYLISLLAGAR